MTAAAANHGDCFKVAAEILLDQMTEGGVWLCHGQPRFRGEPQISVDYVSGKPVETLINPGDRYWHAWIETQTTVYDFANGRELVCSIEAFYVIGQINRVQVRRYTYRQAHALIIASGTWGPWGES